MFRIGCQLSVHAKRRTFGRSINMADKFAVHPMRQRPVSISLDTLIVDGAPWRTSGAIMARSSGGLEKSPDTRDERMDRSNRHYSLGSLGCSISCGMIIWSVDFFYVYWLQIFSLYAKMGKEDLRLEPVEFQASEPARRALADGGLLDFLMKFNGLSYEISC